MTEEEYSEALENAEAVKQVCPRQKHPKTLDDFVAVAESVSVGSSAVRVGGMVLDITTAGMIFQVMKAVRKHPKFNELWPKMTSRYAKLVEIGKGNPKSAILDVVDRFWKLARG